MLMQEPRMLLAVLKELEEGNLFLIQNAQEGEEGLEDARQEMAAVRGRLDTEAAELSGQHAWLQHSCASALARCEMLRVQSLLLSMLQAASLLLQGRLAFQSSAASLLHN